MSTKTDQPVMDEDFDVPESVQPVINRVHEFIEDEVLPFEHKHADQIGGSLSYLDENGRMTDEHHELQMEVRRRAGNADLYALHMPEEVGGGGLSLREHMYVQEEVFRYGTGHGSSLVRSMMAWTEGPTSVLLHLNEDQREQWLEPLIAGRETACIAITEPGAGSDIGSIETTARKNGSEWVINGNKTYITNAPFADTAQILAKTDQAPGPKGMAIFLVDTDADGFEVGEMNLNLMMDGITADLHLDDVRVPDEQMVGDIGDGLGLALSWINWRRLCRPGMCVGMGRYLLERMCQYTTTREAFGDPISQNQAVSFPIAETATEIHATRAMGEKLLDKYESVTSLEELHQPPQAKRLVSMVKYYPEDMLFTWADRAIQAMGGHGLMREGGVERVFRVARNLRIPAGTTEIQKRTIAETLGLTE